MCNPRMRPFSKIKFLSDFGLLACKVNYATQRFEKCFSKRLKASLILFLIASCPFKFYLSKFFEREDPAQLIIGSVVFFLLFFALDLYF